MDLLIFAALNVAASCILTFGLYLRRHHRRDLAVSYIGINIGVFAVAAALSATDVGMGLGLGLFGVLSIIRLRSNELEQHEIAYYFSALAIGLICGLSPSPVWIAILLVTLILVAMLLADHGKVLKRYRHQEVILDHAISDEDELREQLSLVLGGAEIKQAIVQQLDLVNDKMIINVRYLAADSAPRLSRNTTNHEVIMEDAK